jgi:hypothetical protein
MKLDILRIYLYTWANFNGSAYKSIRSGPVLKKSHLTADGQSTSLSWCQATVWDPWPIFIFSFPLKLPLDSCGCSLWREDGSPIYSYCLASPTPFSLGYSSADWWPNFIVRTLSLPRPIRLRLYIVEVEVKLRPTVSRPVCLGVRHPTGTRDQFFFLLEIFCRQLRVCYFVTPSLNRRRVCNLLLLLALSSAVPLGSESRVWVWDSPQPGGPGPRTYIPQEQGGPDIPPGTGLGCLYISSVLLGSGSARDLLSMLRSAWVKTLPLQRINTQL